MSTTSARVLELLTLLQSRRHWSGDELAARLGVSPRTLRRDVGSLQDLGYPITTTRGTGGGYQLSPGASLPPLVLSEDEAAAVVLALKEAAGHRTIETDAAVSALAKIVQVLPGRIRRRIDSLQGLVTLPGPFGVPSTVDSAVLTTFTLAARDRDSLTFAYADARGATSTRHVQPHHVVSVRQRLYLVAYDLTRGDWRSFRIDRATDPRPTGKTFAPRDLPVADPAEFVRSRIDDAGVLHEVSATVFAGADHVRGRVGRWGTVTPVDDGTCTVRIPSKDLDWTAFALAAIGAPFTVDGPPEAIAHMAGWAERLAAATGDPEDRA